MSGSETIQLPSAQSFHEAISALDLPISGSELHGTMCGYLVAGDAITEQQLTRNVLKLHMSWESA